MSANKTDMTTKELVEWVDALGSAVGAQQPVNQAVYERMSVIEKRISEIADTQRKILDHLAGDSK